MLTDEEALKLAGTFDHCYVVTAKAADGGRKRVFRTNVLINAKEFIDGNKLDEPRIFHREYNPWRLVE